MFENASLCYLRGSDHETRRAALDSFLEQCEESLPNLTCIYDDVVRFYNVAVFSDMHGDSMLVLLPPWDGTKMHYPIAEIYFISPDGWATSGTIFYSELSGLEYSGDTPGDSFSFPNCTVAETIHEILNRDF